MPSSGLSSGCTGTCLYALLTSHCAMSSTDTYDKEQLFESMSSFTLVPCGCERSRMRRHFPGLLHFGITPNLLICKFTMIGSNGSLITLFASHSALRYSPTTSGCSYAEIIFCFAEVHGRAFT